MFIETEYGNPVDSYLSRLSSGVQVTEILTLFTDFDGVLHPEFCHESKRFCRLSILEDILRAAPSVEIVISSTWRQLRAFDVLRAQFSPDIASRVVGITPTYANLADIPDRLLGYQREAECVAWLRAYRGSSVRWLALDDRPWLFRPFSTHLVQTDGKLGLDEVSAQALAQRIQQMLRT